MEARGLEELTEVSEPAWPELVSKVSSAALPVEIVPADPALGRATLLQLQVTARSHLGAFALHCGGLLVDDGWLRVFGSATPRNPGGLPGLAEVNVFPERFDPDWRPSPGLIVAQDVLGGTFAVNDDDPAAAGRPGQPGEVVYFAPDTLRWQALALPYEGWLDWVLAGEPTDFYRKLRWPGWRADSRALETATDGISLVPPLWSLEAQRDLAGTKRQAVPMAELLGLHHRYARQLTQADPGFLGVTDGLD
ncbi:DUF2625 family protein [Streptomyces sp. NBRC 109706]|uniref:DUF2625 family protein n=1 Tax=Streptomyces sp. NBRC 109706 TaxID=1550035 RepID=UPI00078634C9|nr:DUF2625 family protein [Streptomyces sp. NBRC 109706]